jgi:hypothetical protein
MSTALAAQTERVHARLAVEKGQVAHAPLLEARDVVQSGVRMRHLTWSSEQVAATVRELMHAVGAVVACNGTRCCVPTA